MCLHLLNLKPHACLSTKRINQFWSLTLEIWLNYFWTAPERWCQDQILSPSNVCSHLWEPQAEQKLVAAPCLFRQSEQWDNHGLMGWLVTELYCIDTNWCTDLATLNNILAPRAGWTSPTFGHVRDYSI